MEYNIQIPDDLHGCHPIITKTRQAQFHRPKLTEQYSAPRPTLGILDLRISKSALPRALRLLEAIIRASEKAGWSVEGKNEKAGARIRIGDDPVTFSMVEQSGRIELPSTKEERAWSYWRPRFKYEDNGRLTLQITDWLPTGMRRSWSDGKKQRLEDVLTEFMDGIAAASAALKERRLEFEERERRWAEERRQREEQERRVQIEKSRRTSLIAQIAGRERAILIRRLIADVENDSSAVPSRWPNVAVQKWIAWAVAIADRCDPLTNGYFEDALKWPESFPELDCPL